MRKCTVLTLFVISAIIVLGGCGGNDVSPKTVTGDVFPLATDAEWTYNFSVSAYYGRERVDADAVSTRKVENNVVHPTGIAPAAAANALRTSTVTDFFPVFATPALAFHAGSTMGAYADYLFALDGGLRNWNGYFESRGHGTKVTRMVRAASGPQLGTAIPLPNPQPFLRVPLVTGEAMSSSLPFMTVPFFSNNETLNGTDTTCGIQWRAPARFLGQTDSHPFVTLVEHLEATINFQGATGACTGVVRSDLAKDIGPVLRDVDLEFKLAGSHLRLHILMKATNFTP